MKQKFLSLRATENSKTSTELPKMSSQKHSPKSNGETEVNLREEIQREVESLMKKERDDFTPSSDWKAPDDLDELADELFDMLYGHTNK